MEITLIDLELEVNMMIIKIKMMVIKIKVMIIMVTGEDERKITMEKKKEVEIILEK